MRVSLGLSRDGKLLFWALMAWEFGIACYNLLQTIYMERLGASPAKIGLLLGIQGVARIAVTLPSGIIAERYSRRRVVVATTAVTVPAALLIGVAQAWWQLVPGLILIMVGNMGTPALSSYIVDITTPATRARAFTLIYSVAPAIATIVAPTFGGFVAERIALRAIFFVSAAAYAVSTVIIARISERPVQRHANAVKASYRQALAVPVVRWVGMLELGVLATIVIGLTLMPNYLEDHRGLGIGTIGRFGSVNAVGSIVLSLVIARSAAITGSKGIAIGVLAIGGLCAVVLATHSQWVIGPAFLLRGGFLVTWSLFHAVLGDAVPDRLRSRAFALGDFLGAVGFGVAPFIAGPLYGWRPDAPLLGCVVLAPMLAVAAVWGERRYVAPAMRARGEEAGLVGLPGSVEVSA